MSDGSPDDFDRSYVAGLLDATGRVRFDVSETGEGTYTVRPMLRIDPAGTGMREAVVGEFLESRGYVYDFVERSYGATFFRLQQRRDLEDLQHYLAGESAQLVRELEFTTTTFADEFDFDILSPEETYRFLLGRDELRYGWRPRGRYHLPPEDLLEAHDLDAADVTPPELPAGRFRTDYTVEWIAGVYDGLGRYRPSIAKSEEHAVGYAMYPTATLHRAGVSQRFVDHLVRFADDYDLDVGDSSTSHALNLVFSGPSNIRRVLDVLLPRLLVLAEHSLVVLEEILPRFDREVHHEKQGFFELLRDFESVARDSGGPYSPHEYDLEYFADRWGDALDLTEVSTSVDRSPTDARLSAPEERAASSDVSVSVQAYPDSPGRFYSVVDTVESDRKQVLELRERYGDRCQVCRSRRATGDGSGYSEVHYLRPLGEPHDGPRNWGNMLVVCPNHHADLDNGLLGIDPEDLTVEHPYESAVDGRELLVHEDHEPDRNHLEYHRETIQQLRTVGEVD